MNKVKAHFKDPLSYYKIAYFIRDYLNLNTIVVCIGTDRCIGDCLGPLVGTLLEEKRFPLPVFGTVSEPIHALNIDKRLQEIKLAYADANIIGIDACLGDIDSIGEIQARDFSIHPGKGVGKTLPHVGESSIIGIVDSTESNIFTNNTIRLDLVLNMSKIITESLLYAYNLNFPNLCNIKYK